MHTPPPLPHHGPSCAQKALTEKWSHIGRFFEDTGAEGVAAIRNMERNFEVSHQVLRELHCLFTPTSRRAVLPAMLEKAVSRKTFEEAVRVAQKEQWVEFHWSADNPLIHPAVRMFFPPPFVCARDQTPCTWCA